MSLANWPWKSVDISNRILGALALLVVAAIIASTYISVVEGLGHAVSSELVPSFTVTEDGAPSVAPVLTHLANETYRYDLKGVQSVTFSAEIASLLRSRKDPALLVTDAHAFISVRLNGTLLSDQGGRDGPIPDRQMEPRLYYLGAAIQGDPSVSEQVLTISLKATGGRPFLREVFVSETPEAVFAYRARRFNAVEGVVAATSIAIFAGLLTLAVTPLLERKKIAGYFAVMMLLWAARNFTFVGPISDVSIPIHQAFYYGTTFLILFTTVRLIDAWTFDSEFMRRYFAIGLFLALILLYLPVMADMPDGVAWSRQIGNIIGVCCFAMMIGQIMLALVAFDNPPWPEMFLFLVCLCFGVIEIGGDASPELARWFLRNSGLSMAYGPLMPLPLASGMLVNFVRQSVVVRDHLKTANAGLAKTLVAREAHIAEVYAQREEDVRQNALMQERQRIMRDMHDGIGSQLLGLLFQARAQKLSPSDLKSGLQESLDDLHLVVESLDQAGHSLEESLGAFRARISPKCDAAGITLEWEVGDLGVVEGTGPAKVLQVYRILQEACINAIRHGNPRTIRIDAQQEPHTPRGVRILVEDDGQGFDTTGMQKRGRGLANMRRRAEAAGGSLTIESAPGLTRLTIHIPVEPSPDLQRSAGGDELRLPMAR